MSIEWFHCGFHTLSMMFVTCAHEPSFLTPLLQVQLYPHILELSSWGTISGSWYAINTRYLLTCPCVVWKFLLGKPRFGNQFGYYHSVFVIYPLHKKVLSWPDIWQPLYHWYHLWWWWWSFLIFRLIRIQLALSLN